MRKTFIAAALAASCTAPAFAQITANVGVVSDYVFRGISQTRGEPALQGGVDFAHDSGIYVGAWGSNVKWVSEGGIANGNRFETDLYGGYKTDLNGLGLDVGMIRYVYPSRELTGAFPSPNTTEAYIGFSYGIVSLKYNHTVSDHFISWVGVNGEKTRGSNYTDLTVTYPVAEGTNLIAHIGRQNIKNYSQASYTDWRLGVTKNVGFGEVGFAMTGSDADQTDGNLTYGKDAWNGYKIAGTRAVLSFLKTF